MNQEKNINNKNQAPKKESHHISTVKRQRIHNGEVIQDDVKHKYILNGEVVEDDFNNIPSDGIESNSNNNHISDHQHQHVHNGEIIDDDNLTPSNESNHVSDHQ
ncbi:MAG: hypothetical protein ACRDC3_00910, partial [Paraclostridium dentum]